MNDYVLKEIDRCVRGAEYYKERFMNLEYQYLHGKMQGMYYACRILGLYDEGNLIFNLTERYPFKGRKPVDKNKIPIKMELITKSNKK